MEANEGMCSLRVAADMRAGERPSLSLPIRINAREGASAHKRMKVAGDGPLAEDGAHGGLDGLGVVQVDAVGGEVDGADAEPVGQAQDGAGVPRVADGIQSEAKA